MYIVSSSSINVLSMLILGCIMIWSVTNMFMHSLPDMILLYLATPFYTKGVLYEIKIYPMADQVSWSHADDQQDLEYQK